MTYKRLRNWMQWLTPLRLERWNHIRHRAGQEPIDRESGARLLGNLWKSKDREDQETLNAVKEQIAE